MSVLSFDLFNGCSSSKWMLMDVLIMERNVLTFTIERN